MGLFSFFKNKGDNKKLSPESKWIIEITQSNIKTIDYDGFEESIESKLLSAKDRKVWFRLKLIYCGKFFIQSFVIQTI